MAQIKVKHELWNRLFYGSLFQNGTGERYPRKGGLLSHLDAYNDGFIRLHRELLVSAAKDKDLRYLGSAKPFCKFLQIDYEKFMRICNTVWELEGRA